MQTPDRPIPSLFIIGLMQVMVGICLFIALLYGLRDLTLLGLLVLGIAIGARLWSRMSLSGIRCSVKVDKHRIFPGESFCLQVSAENAKFLPVWLQVRVPFEGALAPLSGQMSFTDACGLLWYQQVRFRRHLVARRRGVYRAGPVHMELGDLFGFFLRSKRTSGDTDVIVFPRLVPLKPFSLTSRDFFGLPGARSPVADPVYILGTRDYQPGRPARHIHWKASARHNRLQEKVFEPSQQEKVLLAVEISQFEKAGASDSFERTLEVVGSLALQAHQKGYALGFATNGVVQGGSPGLPIGRSAQQLGLLLEILARLKMRAAGSLTGTLQRAMDLPWGASCIHFSYAQDGETQAAARYFSNRRIPMIFVSCSGAPLKADEPAPEGKIYGLDEIRIEEARKA